MLGVILRLLSTAAPETSTLLQIIIYISLIMQCREGNLEMILKTNKVVVGHVFDRIVHKFSTRDGWFVNYIKHTDHFIDKESQSEGVVTPLPPGHHCQDIEV